MSRVKIKSGTIKTSKKRTSANIKRIDDTTVIKKHFSGLKTEDIKKALIASGIYDQEMRLTASYK